MSADLNSILVGYRGKVDMLKACFGSADEDQPAESTKDWRDYAKTHNTIFKSMNHK